MEELMYPTRKEKNNQAWTYLFVVGGSIAEILYIWNVDIYALDGVSKFSWTTVK